MIGRRTWTHISEGEVRKPHPRLAGFDPLLPVSTVRFAADWQGKVDDRDKQGLISYRGFIANSMDVDPLKPYWERRVKPSALQSSLPTP